MTDIKTKVTNYTEAVKTFDLMETEIQADLEYDKQQLLRPAFSALTQGSSINQKYSTIRGEFGSLFYGILVPINGFSLKNRRYADGSQKNKGWHTPEGPCVHQKIGSVQSWGSKAHWYTENEIWDRLKQEHIDLIENGKKTRKDQKKVAQDFFNYREKIKRLMREDKAVAFTFSEPLTLTGIVRKDNRYQETVDASITGGIVNHDNLRLKFIIPEAVTKDVTGTHADNIDFDYLNNELKAGDRYYSPKVYILGMDAIANTVEFKTAYNELTSTVQEAFDTWAELKDKHAGRLLMKGIF